MRKLKFKLDRRSFQTIYFAFIRPLLEYADVVWENCTKYEVNDLFSDNLTDSPLCTSGIEYTYYYLFVCNRFSNL